MVRLHVMLSYMQFFQSFSSWRGKTVKLPGKKTAHAICKSSKIYSSFHESATCLGNMLFSARISIIMKFQEKLHITQFHLNNIHFNNSAWFLYFNSKIQRTSYFSVIIPAFQFNYISGRKPWLRVNNTLRFISLMYMSLDCAS